MPGVIQFESKCSPFGFSGGTIAPAEISFSFMRATSACFSTVSFDARKRRDLKQIQKLKTECHISNCEFKNTFVDSFLHVEPHHQLPCRGFFAAERYSLADRYIQKWPPSFHLHSLVPVYLPDAYRDGWFHSCPDISYQIRCHLDWAESHLLVSTCHRDLQSILKNK